MLEPSSSNMHHVTALIACGGQSTRMKEDKSLLTYHQLPQRYHLYKLLKLYCPQVFLSVNEDQSGSIAPGYQFICDDPEFSGSGPIAALLTVWKSFPDHPILLIGCDYPFLDESELQHFLQTATQENNPCAFFNANENIFEPLLAWYPASCHSTLSGNFTHHQYSLRRFLEEANARAHTPLNPRTLFSADDPEKYRYALDSLRSQ